MRRMPALRTLPLLAASGLLFASPVLAQDDDLFDDEESSDEDFDDDGDDEFDDDEEEEADDFDEDDGAASDSSEPGQRAKIDTEETIYVISGRPRLVGHSIEIVPQFVQSVADRFVSHSGVMLSGVYHLRENMALEIGGGAFGGWDIPAFIEGEPDSLPYFGGHFTDTTTELQERERLTPTELVKLNKLNWIIAGNAQWSPLYGKVSIHDFLLGTFSVYLSVGAGLGGLGNDNLTEMPGLPLVGAMQIMTTLGGGVRFYLFDWLGLRLEVRDYVQPLSLLERQVSGNVVQGVTVAPQSSFEVRNTVLVQAGLSFVIPMPWR